MSEEEKEKYMDQITVKAETLIEALPYNEKIETVYRESSRNDSF